MPSTLPVCSAGLPTICLGPCKQQIACGHATQFAFLKRWCPQQQKMCSAKRATTTPKNANQRLEATDNWPMKKMVGKLNKLILKRTNTTRPETNLKKIRKRPENDPKTLLALLPEKKIKLTTRHYQYAVPLESCSITKRAIPKPIHQIHNTKCQWIAKDSFCLLQFANCHRSSFIVRRSLFVVVFVRRRLRRRRRSRFNSIQFKSSQFNSTQFNVVQSNPMQFFLVQVKA